MAESGTIKIQLAVKNCGGVAIFQISNCNKNVSKTALQFILQHTYTVRDARHPAFRSCRHRFMYLSEIDKMGNITRGRYSRKRRKQGDSRGVHNWTFLASQMTPYRRPVGSGLFSVSDQQIWQLGSFAAFGWVTVTYTSLSTNSRSVVPLRFGVVTTPRARCWRRWARMYPLSSLFSSVNYSYIRDQ